MPETSTLASRWTLVGDGVALGSPAANLEVLDPQGEAIPLLPEQRVFFPQRPGQYSIRDGTATRTISVNIDPRESATPELEPSEDASAPPPPLSPRSSDHRTAIWPLLAAAFLGLLTAEFLVHRQRVLDERRLG